MSGAPEEPTGDEPTDSAGPARRATLETTHDDPAAVAAAVTPDNTEEMVTRVEGGRVVTTVERDATGSLQSTVDDYVVNLAVAERTATIAKRTTDTDHNDTP